MEVLGYDELLTELQLGHSMPTQYGKAWQNGYARAKKGYDE